MDDILRIFIYIICANIVYLIFSLIRQGFKHYCNYIAELLFLFILILYLLFKGVAAGWVVGVALVGICVLVLVPHLLQVRIDSLLSENFYDEIEPYAKLKAALAWSEPNSHLHDISKIAEEYFEDSDKLVENLRAILGRGEPYDSMTRLFLGMIHFNNRNFNELIRDVKIPDKKYEEQSFEELLYLVRGYLETTMYEQAVEAQFALEQKISEDRDAKADRSVNAIINRFVFFAFLGWKDEFDEFLRINAGDLERLPIELRDFWRGVCYFNAGDYDDGEKMMRTVIRNFPSEDKAGYDFMIKRLLGMVEHKEFFDAHILPKLQKLHQEYSQKLISFVDKCRIENEEIPMKSRVTGMLSFCVLLLSVVWIVACDVNDVLELIKMGANGQYFAKIGEYYRTLTYMFVHAGWGHLAMNILSLRYFGAFVETVGGWPLMLLVYFISGIVGGFFSANFGVSLSVGASGGILGLLGAATVFCLIMPKMGAKVSRPISLSTLLFILVINIVIGLLETGRIDNFCHAGGFLAGMLVAFVFVPAIKKGKKLKKVADSLALLVVAILLFYGFGAHMNNFFSDSLYPKTLNEFVKCNVDKHSFETEIPKDWKIDEEISSKLWDLEVSGCFFEKLTVVVGKQEEEPLNFLADYIVQRTNFFEKEDGLELLSVNGPEALKVRNNSYRVRWTFSVNDTKRSLDDYFIFENDYNCVVRFVPSTSHIDEYQKIIDNLIEKFKIKE